MADAKTATHLSEAVAEPIAVPKPSRLKVWAQDFVNGVRAENPVLKLVLGLCPALAVSTSVFNALGMGIAATFVLTGSSFVVALLRNFIPSRVRIPSFIVVIASFVTIADLSIAAISPELYEALGIFIPLIVVNCIILARAEAFASKNPVAQALSDGLGMGLGFTLSLLLLGAIREVLGNGTVLGYPLFGESFSPVIVLVLPAGSFLVLGGLVAIFNLLQPPHKPQPAGLAGAEAGH